MRLPALLLVLATSAIAQEFEVATVKPAATDALGSEITTPPNGGIHITNLPLKPMIMYAWDLKSFQVSGAKGWIEWQAYDVVAKPAVKPKEGELKLMLKALLAERFGLVVHREMKEQPIYTLGVAKPGKLGPGLVEFREGGCPEFDKTRPPAPPAP